MVLADGKLKPKKMSQAAKAPSVPRKRSKSAPKKAPRAQDEPPAAEPRKRRKPAPPKTDEAEAEAEPAQRKRGPPSEETVARRQAKAAKRSRERNKEKWRRVKYAAAVRLQKGYAVPAKRSAPAGPAGDDSDDEAAGGGGGGALKRARNLIEELVPFETAKRLAKHVLAHTAKPPPTTLLDGELCAAKPTFAGVSVQAKAVNAANEWITMAMHGAFTRYNMLVLDNLFKGEEAGPSAGKTVQRHDLQLAASFAPAVAACLEWQPVECGVEPSGDFYLLNEGRGRSASLEPRQRMCYTGADMQRL